MRQPLNDFKIKSNNQKEYYKFFAAQQLIISSAGGFILAGSNTHFADKIAIHYRVPLRNYIGINITTNKDVKIISIKNFDTSTNSFIEQEADSYYLILADYLQKQLIKSRCNFGLAISCLNEIPRRNGLNNPGTYAANIVSAFLLLTNKIKHTELNHQVVSSNSPIAKYGKEFHRQLNTINASGFGCLSSFPQTRLPIIYAPSATMSLSMIVSDIEKADYPVDIIVIGTSDVGNIDFPLHDYRSKLKINYQFNVVPKNLSASELIGKDIALEDIGKRYIRKQYLNASNASTVQTLLSIGDAFNKPNRDSINRLLRSLNNAFTTQELTSNAFFHKKLIQNIISYYFSTQLTNTPYATVTSIANHLVICTPPDSIRAKADKLIAYIQSNINSDISIPYVSWVDGYDNRGTSVEQWLDKDIRSDLFPKSSQIVLSYPRIASDYTLENSQNIQKKINNTDIFIDTDSNKIYIRGKKLDSSIIPSSTSAVDLLVRLLSHPSRIVSSSDLPDTSYYRDRNELQSKILTPLKKAVLLHINKHLSICSHGGLTNYSVVIEDCEVSIRILTRK